MKLRNLLQLGAITVLTGVLFSCESNEHSNSYETEKQEKVPQEVSSEDEKIKKFVMEAASDGMMEIKMAEIAMETSENDSIKQLASVIKTDHKDANQKLKSIAGEYNWEVPEKMLEKHKEKVNKLKEVPEEEFDMKYLEMMEKGHKKAIDKFTEAETMQSNESGTDMANLKTWIDETLPVLRKHKEKVKNLMDNMED